MSDLPAESDHPVGASDCLARAPSPKSDREIATERLSRRLVRVGWWICGGGLPITLLGNRLLAADGKSPSDFAQAVHTFGLLIMLGGLLTALAGYRTPAVHAAMDIQRRLWDARWDPDALREERRN